MRRAFRRIKEEIIMYINVKIYFAGIVRGHKEERLAIYTRLNKQLDALGVPDVRS